MLKRLTSPVDATGVATVRYLEADFKVEVPGSHVLCAETGAKIVLDELKYWNWERQEAYVDHHASMAAELKARAAR